MLLSSSFQAGFPPEVDRQAFLDKLQTAKDKMNQEVISSASTAAPVDSQTSTDYGTLPSGVPTTPTQTNYGSFPMDVPITPTQETNYGLFPVAGINTEEMDHEATEPVAQEDDTMMEAGDDNAAQDQQGTADSSPLSSVESTPRQLPRRPMEMFNQPGGSIIARRYRQQVGMPQTVKISSPGLFHERGGSDDQSDSANLDEELKSPTVQAAQQKQEAVQSKPTNRLLYTPKRNKSTYCGMEAAKSVDSQEKLMEAVGES
ncbi:hypothetical protein BDD12DRAFT_895781 [Trichophaea hybrida]|nr:hypothetical protein BDD12DRAFT_895781 [Trichophaea hybrida]